MGSRLAKLMAVGLVASNVALADEAPDWGAETLSGDWGGARSGMHEKGVTVELTHKSDRWTKGAGGVARGSERQMNSEAAVSVYMDKLAGWSGGSAFVQYHVQHGNQSINNYVGSFAGVDNIETGTSTGQFFQAWLQQNSSDDSLSLLAGLYAIDSEFYVTDTSGLFLQPPYGMSAEMAQTGRNGPPVFPMGALALRLKYTGAGFYAQAALTDGVPGNLNNAHGTQIRLDRGDGTLAVAEFGLTPDVAEGQYNKMAIGLWRYSTKDVRDSALDPTNVDAFGNPLQHDDQGAYLLAERTLTTEEGDSAQGLSGFVRFGVVNKNVYQADWSGSIGLNYLGLIDGRDEDAFGVALTASHASSWYRQALAAESSETVVEITYRAQVEPWLAIQPVVQRIFNPNMDPAVADAWTAGIRLEAAF